MPLKHVERAISIFGGFGDKTKGMITAPLFALFFESVDDKFVDLFFISHKKVKKIINKERCTWHMKMMWVERQK